MWGIGVIENYIHFRRKKHENQEEYILWDYIAIKLKYLNIIFSLGYQSSGYTWVLIKTGREFEGALGVLKSSSSLVG